MSRFKDGVTRLIVDVRTRGNPNAADLSRQGIGEVIAVEIQSSDDIVILRADERELQAHISNRVFDEQHLLPLAVAVGIPQLQGFFHFALDVVLLGRRHHIEAGVNRFGVIFHRQFRLCFLVAQDPGLALGDDLSAEFALGEGITPILESTFGELHDIALMDEVHALALVFQRPLDRSTDESLSTFHRNRFDANARGFRETHLRIFLRERFLEHAHEFLVIFGAVLEFNAGVNIFGVLAEDDHVHMFGVLHGGRHALIPTHRSLTNIQVQQLAERHIQRTDAAADRSCERAFDTHQKFTERLGCFIGQPALEHLERLLARVHFHPVDLALAAVGLFHSRIEHTHRSAPDVASRAIALNKRNDRIIGNIQLPIFNGNLRPACGDRNISVCHAYLFFLWRFCRIISPVIF